MEVIVQHWIESEAGWGIRPDGIAIHASQEKLEEYNRNYFDRLYKLYGSSVPYEYSRPGGDTPIKMRVISDGADERILQNVLAGTSFRHWCSNPSWLKPI